MKSVLTAMALVLSSSFAFADHYDDPEILECRVTRMVDYTYFEEGLSTDEYPSIYVHQSAKGEVSISYGSHGPYEAAEGYKVTMTTKKFEGIKVTSIDQYGNKVTLQTEYVENLARGKVTAQEKGEKTKTIAYVMCDKGLFN